MGRMSHVARRKANHRKAIAYIRASTDEQRLTPDAQREAIATWAAREGVTVVAEHVETGVSGAAELDDRPALMAALAGLKEHGAGLLVVLRRDRLARDVYLAGAIDRACAARGARVVSADGTGNGDTPADQFMRTILDGAAAYERELIRARTRAALKAKRARGERAGNVPFGWRALDDGTLIAHEPEQAVLVQVRALRAAGLSLRGIVAELERAGIRGRTGKALALTQVARLVGAA